MRNRLLILASLVYLFLPSFMASALQEERPVYLQVITLKTQVDLDSILALLKSGQEFSDLAQNIRRTRRPAMEGSGGLSALMNCPAQ